jgi:PAS domain S-box-containing protein
MSRIATRRATRQKIAEGEVDGFRRSLGPFVVAAETTRSAMVFTNAAEAGNPIIFANDAFLALTGYDREEVLGKPFDFLLARGNNLEALARIEAAFAGEFHEQLEICDQRRDGGTFWASLSINPVWDAEGLVVQHFSSFVDITGTKREAERLRFLLDELNHRTQNTLATVLAIAAQTLRSQDGPVVQAFEARVLALAKAHGLLGRGSWDAVPLRDVLDRILQPWGLGGDAPPRITLGGEDARLHAKAALSLALVFHELAANASTHGALSVAEGQVDIGWRVEITPDDTRLHLRWQESGGPLVASPSRKGFGSRLIERGLAQDIGGEVRVTYEQSGLICQIAMPLKPPVGS